MTGTRYSSFALMQPGPLRLYSTAELLKLPPPSWLIDPILPAGGLVALYGPPGHGKSFVAIDMAMSIASGVRWQGYDTASGFVLYVSAEGGTGIGKRAQAWLKHHNITRPWESRMGWLTEALPLHADSDSLDTLLTRMKDELEFGPCLVVIDTLARCFDGDENTQLDMGRFIQGVDLLRREFAATVLVVHHTRLGGDRERGNTAFRGAADCMISVEKEGSLITLVNNKQKDAEEWPALSYILQPIKGATPVWDSCVLIGEKLNRDGAILHALTTDPDANSYTELLQAVKGSQIGAAQLKRGLLSLQQSGQIIKENRKYALLKAH